MKSLHFGGERRVSGESSWWVGLDREAFAARCAQETERMATSRFGRLLLLSSAGDVSTEDRWRKRRVEL